MTIDYQRLRLDGVYRQNDAGQLMLRVKVPASVLSVPQVEALCILAESFSNGRLHLTCRGSVELHGVEHDRLPEIFRQLAMVGLTTRGACGGAVRGISCSTSAGPGLGTVQRVVRRLHRHFTGNPHFEGLPKKFKIGVESGYDGARHLIQDFGIVHTGNGRFDVWCAGGLGREPQAGFLLCRNVVEEELLSLAEAVVRVYARHAPAGKRLKHVAREFGRERLRELIADACVPAPPTKPSLNEALDVGNGVRLDIPVFAGEIEAAQLRLIARAAAVHGDGMLILTANQDLALFLPDQTVLERIRNELTGQGLFPGTAETAITCRICPGNHECRMGLAPTRDVARQVIAALGPQARTMTWAVSGCPNSCPQPQLADVGIITGKLVKADDGSRTPRFDLYRRNGDGLGTAVATGLDLNGLLAEVGKLG
ncbi:MAG: nitrite/sulfite reductase [Desulfuromonadales bacterium]|nr:nitrite/sulfite reductase [Desulfuromonadales bacterium]